MSEKWLALAFSLMILGQAWLVRRYVGTWLFPACLFGLFWFALTFIPLVVLFQVPVAPLGIGFILLCCLAFSATALAFDWRPAFARNRDKPDARAIYGSVYLGQAFYVSVGTALALVVLTALAQGVTLIDLVFNLLLTARAYAELRYAGDLASQLLERWSVVAAYLGVILGGLRYASVPRRRGLTLLLAFLPTALIAVTQSAKWHFLLGIALFFGGVLVQRISSGTLRLAARRQTRLAAFYGSLAAAIITLSFLSRVSTEESDFSRLLAGRFASYVTGHTYAFADWYAWETGGRSALTYSAPASGGGFYTFGSLLRLAGRSDELPVGGYDDDYEHGGYLQTNVFTMFRGLIIDFGQLGALVFMAAVGLAFHGAFYALLSRRHPVGEVVAFLFMMGFFFSSFVFSMLGSNILYYVTFGLLWLILSANRRLTAAAAPAPLPANPQPILS